VISAKFYHASSSHAALRTARLIKQGLCDIQRDSFPAKLADLPKHYADEIGLGVNQTCFTLTGFGVFGTKR
jgi:hypothetical protein